MISKKQTLKNKKKLVKKSLKQPKLNINRIYCIAIPKRLEYIKKTLFDYFQFPKTKVTFIKPYLKDKLDKEELIKKGIVDKNCTLNLGQIACYLSHTKVLKQFLKSKEEQVIVFEDDLKRKDKNIVHDKINNIIQIVPKDFDIIYLGRYYDWCMLNEDINQYLYRTYYCTGMHSFIIKRNAAKIILDNIFPINNPIDDYVAYLNLTKKLVCYCAKNNIFDQKNDEGILKSTLKMYDFKENHPECKLYSNILREIKFMFQ